MDALQNLLDSILSEGRASGAFPSAAAAIGQRDAVLAQSFIGCAPLPEDRPVNAHTRYDMASLSKVLGPTMIALKALEDGELDLTTRVADYFPQTPPDKQEITLKHLMTHTGGFAPFFRLDQALDDPKDAVDYILSQPLEERPGVRPIYSCMGYILFAKILEKHLGAPLNELAKNRVFDPLGMTETGYCPPRDAICAATEIDPATNQPIIGVVHDENARFLRGVSGNAGVFMPLCDGIRFAGMLGNMGGDYLKRETMERATVNYTPGQDEHRGLGFHLAGTPDCFFSTGVPARCFGHTGFTGTSLIVEPETGFWVLLLTNRVYPTRESAGLFPLRRRLHAESWRLFCEEKGL